VAANLLKAGLPVLVFDRNPAAVDKLVKLGAKAVGSPQEMGETPGKPAAAAAAAGQYMLWRSNDSSSMAGAVRAGLMLQFAPVSQTGSSTCCTKELPVIVCMMATAQAAGAAAAAV
jgi:hypothetical protein